MNLEQLDLEVSKSDAEKLKEIEALIAVAETQTDFTIQDYRELETELNKIQQGIKPEHLLPFTSRVQALWEKVKDQKE
ncbi:hypothetical protein KJ840_01380 [Patescibacteria group bacterium]|nr:hypothetical protein [Patescibacteria group bacterium]